ncbi:MAG: hypothetical protein U1E56_01270 [Bauldia sp.]
MNNVLRTAAVAVPALLAFSVSATAADPLYRPAAPSALSPWAVVAEGWFGTSGNSGTENVDPDNDHLTHWGGNLRANYMTAGGVSVQGDFSFERTNNNRGADEINDFHVLGLHVDMHTANGLFGVIGGIARTSVEVNVVRSWFVGGEAQFGGPAQTFLVQGGWFDADFEEESIHRAWFVRGLARHYFMPGTSIQAEFSYLNGKQDSDDQTGRALNWGARLDHQIGLIPGVNTGAFFAYRGRDFRSLNDGPTDNGKFVEHTFMGGIRITLGGDAGGLDRAGRLIDLPDIGGWTGAGPIVD